MSTKRSTKKASASRAPTPQVRCREFTLERRAGMLWLARDSGEGMEVDESRFAALLRCFWELNF